MKELFKYALVLLTAAGLASCQSFEDVDIFSSGNYSVIVNTSQTKTANDGYNTVWSSGDEMTMFWKSSQGSPHNGKFTYASNNKFTTTADVGTSDCRWYGVYPYSSSNTSYTSVSASISVTQTQDGNGSMAHLAGSGFPLWGRTDDYVPNKQTPQFTAHQVATVLKFDVKNGDDKAIVVNKIVFTAPTAIAGNCKADLTATTVAWTPASSGTSNSVTLNVTGGAAINKGDNAAFFVGAIPFSKNGQYSVTVYATADGKNFESTTTANGNFVANAGTINTVPVTFVGKEVTSKTYTKTTSFTSGKKYVIVYDGHALQNNNGSPAAYSVSASGNTLTLASDLASTLEWTATSVSTYTGSGHYSLTNNGKYAARTDDGNNGFEFQTSAVQKAVWDLDNEGNDLYHKNSNGQYTFYLTYSSSKWTVDSQQASNKIAVYVEGGSSDDPTDPPVPDGKCYVKVTSAPADWSGTYLIVDESANMAFDENAGSYASTVTISGGKIAWSENVAKYQVTVSPSSISGMYDVKTVKGQYMYSYKDGETTLNSSKTQTSNGATNTYYNSLSISGGNVTMYSTRNGKSGASVNYFGYESSKSNNPNSKNFGYKKDATTRTVQLYKLNEGVTPAKQDQNLTFAESTVEWTLGDDCTIGGTYNVQSVSGVETTVTYSSSNTDVATITNEGKIKIVAAGTTNIIATAAEDATYNSASASYTLTIKPASTPSTSKTYTKTTSFTSGKKYVIVYDGHALQNNNGSPAAYSVSASGNTLTLASDLASSLEWTATSVSDYTISGHYSLTNNGKYAARTDDSQNGFEFRTSAVQKAVWDLDNEGNDLYHKNSNGQYTFYLTYSSSKWTVDSQQASNKIAVYVEGGSSDDPTDPPVPDGKCYVKVTSAPADWSGTYLVVDENAKKAFAYNVSSSYATNVTISDGKIAYSSEYDNIALRVTDAGLDHPNTQVATDLGSGTLRAYNVKTKGGQYIYASQSAVKVADSNSKSDGTTTYYHTFFYDNGVYMVSSGNYGPSSSSRDYYYTLAYSSSKFAYGQGKTKLAKVQLYKLSEGGDEPATKQDQNLSFTKSSKTINSDTFTLGNGTYIAPTLIGAMTTPVTWTSSKTSVATVSNNGTVTIVAAGTTTITASAPASDTYNEASASYELTVSPAQGQPTTKTYTKVSSLSEGTYIICGSEDAGTYVCLFPPVDATYSNQDKKFDTTNKCKHSLFSSSNTITEIKTSDTSIIGSEVEITASGSSWLIKLKSNGLYMYYNNGKIDFTSTSSSAAQTIGSFSSGKTSMKQGNQLFYHSGTNEGFGYKNRSNVSNLMFFKLEGSGPSEPSQDPSEPTPDGTVFNLENSSVSEFLEEAASQYTDSNWSTKSIVTDYCKYDEDKRRVVYTADNREDIPAPVTITWANPASGTKTLTVYNDPDRTKEETSVTSTSTSAEIYNLIPNRTYYYTVSTSGNGDIASGYFKTKGTRRMMLVGDKSEFGMNYANNCRDFGGLKTTDGKTVKYNKIFRGSNMDGTSDNQKAYLKKYMNIELDVDLRGNSKNPLGVGLSGESYNSWTDLSAPNKMKATLKDIFDAVENKKTIYIHCAVGADRTGYVSMLLQALLGVSEKDCSIDYELTSFSTIGVRARSGENDVYFTDGVEHIEGQSGSTFQEKAANYVKSLGFKESDITDFRNNMLEN